MAYTYRQSTADPLIWERKCYGLESLAASMEETLDGFPHLTATIGTSPAHERSKFVPALRAAWISLRHQVPAIAARAARLPAPDNHFTFTYTIPDNKSVEKWAEDTLFVEDGVKDIYDKHTELKDGRWWKPSENHYVGELHASPIANGWQLSVIFCHNSIDGRNGFAILDELLSKLVPILEGTAKPISEFKWGDETARLSPASAIIIQQHNGIEDKSADPPAPPPGPMIPWLWPPSETGSKGDISALVTLPASTTAKLHQLGKQHEKTVTQVITALSILAHAEVALSAASKAGPERFKLVSGSYSQATFYLIAWNFINHRHKLPGGYNSFSSETPPPLVTADGVPLMLSMEPIRKFFSIDEEKSSVSTVTSKDAFWTDLVEETAKGWKSHDTSLQAYWDREVVTQDSIHTFNPGLFHVPALICSSIGDLDRLGIFDSYTPSRQNKTITVTEAISGIRMRVPPLMNLCWQYDGKLSCQWFTAGEHTTKGELVEVVEAFKRWIKEFIV